MVKKFTLTAFVVVDGHHASLNFSDFFHPSVDAVALREGEVTACELFAALEEGRYIGDGPGLAINREGRQKKPPLGKL